MKAVFGKAALDRLYKGRPREGSAGIVFLDFDDVLCLNRPYGGYNLFDSQERPVDLYEKLWHPPAMQALLSIIAEFMPKVVITTSWLRLMERDGFVDLFRRTGLESVADSLHSHWQAPADAGMSRHDAIQRWLHSRHYEGEPVLVLDDHYSGTGLQGSRLDRLGRVVLCEVGVGLHGGHLEAARRALGSSGHSNIDDEDWRRA